MTPPPAALLARGRARNMQHQLDTMIRRTACCRDSGAGTAVSEECLEAAVLKGALLEKRRAKKKEGQQRSIRSQTSLVTARPLQALLAFYEQEVLVLHSITENVIRSNSARTPQRLPRWLATSMRQRGVLDQPPATSHQPAACSLQPPPPPVETRCGSQAWPGNNDN